MVLLNLHTDNFCDTANKYIGGASPIYYSCNKKIHVVYNMELAE